MSDQQFCLRWNNHQSTLVSVFDTLLENNVLVDCTLAAEGQFLKAHKVVLCACSPYLELLLSQHYEKHPILILKDVKFQELKSMMDYMYKGEVNISQDQLGTFLKAAESLQIKGLTDGTGDDSRDVGSTQPKRHEPPRKATHNQQPRSPAVLPHASSGLTIEPRRSTHDVPDSPIRSREGSTSPTPRKRRRPRRPSQGEDYETSYDNGDSQNTAIVPSTNQVTSTPNAIPKIQPPDTDENDELNRIAEAGLIKEKTEPPSEFVEPKMEAEEPPVDDNVEDLTLDDDDELDGMDMGAGPSHSNDNSNQGYGWGLSDRNDDMYLSQDGIAQRDNQGNLKIRGRPRKRITSVEVQLDKEFEENPDFTDERLRSLAHQFRVSLGYIRQWHNCKCIETRHLDKIRDRPISSSTSRKHRGRPPKPINVAKLELEQEFLRDPDFTDDRQAQLSQQLNIPKDEIYQWFITRCNVTKRRRGRPPKDFLNDSSSGPAEIFCETFFNPNVDDFTSDTIGDYHDLFSSCETGRAVISAYQNEQLLEKFRVSPYISAEEETELAAKLGLSEFQIRTWFSRMMDEGGRNNGNSIPNNTHGVSEDELLSFDQIGKLEKLYQSSASVITPELVEQLCKEFNVSAKSIYNWFAERHNSILPTESKN